MKKWEFKVVAYTSRAEFDRWLEALLNVYGVDGWELDRTLTYGATFHVVFKREVL